VEPATGELNLTDALVQLMFSIQALLAAVAGSEDLSLTQVRLLGILRDREPGIIELADMLGLDKSSVSGLVERAERRGLVRRAPAAGDGRAIRVLLTRAGRANVRRVGERVSREIDARTRDLVPADRERLIEWTARILLRDPRVARTHERDLESSGIRLPSVSTAAAPRTTRRAP
jgi:DNA-binding MarR family transcriptional regulator